MLSLCGLHCLQIKKQQVFYKIITARHYPLNIGRLASFSDDMSKKRGQNIFTHSCDLFMVSG